MDYLFLRQNHFKIKYWMQNYKNNEQNEILDKVRRTFTRFKVEIIFQINKHEHVHRKVNN